MGVDERFAYLFAAGDGAQEPFKPRPSSTLMSWSPMFEEPTSSPRPNSGLGRDRMVDGTDVKRDSVGVTNDPLLDTSIDALKLSCNRDSTSRYGRFSQLDEGIFG
jgi:hypothetical protein